MTSSVKESTSQQHGSPFHSTIRATTTTCKHLLTYSIVQNPSWEANWFASSQEIPCISRNPKVHYRTHKRPPPVPILGQPNPVHISISHLLEIHPNIIHTSTPRSTQWSPSLRFPHQDPIHPPLSSPIRATCPAHLILLEFITRTILGEEYKSFSSSLGSLLPRPLDLPGTWSDIAGWIPYHVMAIQDIVRTVYNHHISLQTVFCLIANK